MNITPPILVVAYLLPMLLLALLLLRNRLRQWHIALLLAVLPLFYILHYQGVGELAGWPTTETLPDRFRLLGQQVTEPDRRSGDAGNIRLWVQAEHQASSRLYQVPYSRELHQQLATAEKRASQGMQQEGVRRRGGENSQGAPGERDERIEIRDRPRTSPPSKPDASGR